jgi:hypothetical protein
MLREITKFLVADWNDYSLPDDLIGDLYSFDRSDISVCAYIDRANAGEIQQLILDLLLGNALHVQGHCVDEDPSECETAFMNLVKLEELSATPAEIAIERIDLDKLTNPSDVLEVIAANIEHLAEVAQFISAGAPHHTGNVEAAANQLGYHYSVEGWKKHESAAATQESPAPADPAQVAQNDAEDAEAPARSVLKLKQKAEAPAPAPAPDQAGPVIKVKKTRSVELAPAAAWPFPSGPDRQKM